MLVVNANANANAHVNQVHVATVTGHIVWRESVSA